MLDNLSGRVEGRENVGIWGEILLGEKGKRGKKEKWWRYSCSVRLDVQSREALEELCSTLRFFGLGFSRLPFRILKHVWGFKLILDMNLLSI